MQFIHRKHSEIYFVSRQVFSSVAISDSGEKTLAFTKSSTESTGTFPLKLVCLENRSFDSRKLWSLEDVIPEDCHKPSSSKTPRNVKHLAMKQPRKHSSQVRIFLSQLLTFKNGTEFCFSQKKSNQYLTATLSDCSLQIYLELIILENNYL